MAAETEGHAIVTSPPIFNQHALAALLSDRRAHAFVVVPTFLARGFAAFAIRNYRLFWIGQVITRAGTWMQQISLPWLVLTLGGSPIELGIVAALEFAPVLFLAPFGGVYADRLDRRTVLMVVQILAILQVVTLLILIASGLITIPIIMGLSLALGLVNAVEAPVRQSLVADLVPRQVLTNAIALNAMAFNGARVVGPAIAGLTIVAGTHIFGTVTAGVAFNLTINATSFLVVLVCVWRMNPDDIARPERTDQPPRVLESLREGITYAGRTPMVLWCLVLVAAVEIFGDNFRILLPLFTQDTLGLDADAYGALYATLGLGALCGAVALAFLHERRVIHLMIGGAFTLSACLLVLAFTASGLVAAALLVVSGFSMMMMRNTANVAIQSNVPDHLRGRVMSLWVTVNQGTTPVGGLLAGVLAEAAGVPMAFLIGGIGALTATALVLYRLTASARSGRLGKTRIRPGDRRAP